jgi:antiviral helicase SKI2
VPSAVHSTSMKRAPAAPSSFVRGKSGHVPFWPGGLDESLGLDEDAIHRQGPQGLQSIAPGLSRGMRLPGEIEEVDLLEEVEGTQVSDPDQVGHSLWHSCKNLLCQVYSARKGLTSGVEAHSEIDELLPNSVNHENLNYIVTHPFQEVKHHPDAFFAPCA